MYRVGGAAVCEALGLPTGCDANFSLVANMKADGSCQDNGKIPSQGIHVAVHCINIIDNGVIVSGVITKGTIGGVDVSGQPAITAVMDNGTSAKDPPDQISFSFIGLSFDCDSAPGFPPLINLATWTGHGMVGGPFECRDGPI